MIHLVEKIQASVHLSRSVQKVIREDSRVRVFNISHFITCRQVLVTDTNGTTEEFDEIVFATDAQMPLQVLDRPRWWERKILANVTYYNDITITHEDEAVYFY